MNVINGCKETTISQIYAINRCSNRRADSSLMIQCKWSIICVNYTVFIEREIAPCAYNPVFCYFFIIINLNLYTMFLMAPLLSSLDEVPSQIGVLLFTEINILSRYSSKRSTLTVRSLLKKPISIPRSFLNACSH